MKKIQLIILSLLLSCPVISIAQGFDELVLQLSQPYSGGTARMLGLGGSKVALGGDLGNIYTNSAGLGFYNNSEWVLSPSINYIATNSNYLNTSSANNRLNFNFANAGIVFNRTKGIHNTDKWRGGSFAFTLTRINNFNDNITYQGENTFDDIIAYAVEQDNTIGSNDLTDLIYNVGLTADFVDPETEEEFVGRNIYDIETGEPAYPGADFPVLQREEITNRGGQYAATIAYGGNYDDRIYFGAGLNIMSIDKEIKRVYTEQPTAADLSQLTFTDKYYLTGSGANVNFGFIARPAETVLIGLSYTSPTFYGMEQTQEYSMSASYIDAGAPYTDAISYAPFYYNLFIPSKFRGGITYFFGKNGFLTADVETSKIKNAEFSNGDGYSFNNENQYNRDNFTNTLNAGVGGEYRWDIFRFRAGVNYTSDPKQTEGFDFDRMMYGLGAGIRKKDFFIDLSYNLYQSTQVISPYPDAEKAVVDKSNSMTTISFGFNL